MYLGWHACIQLHTISPPPPRTHTATCSPPCVNGACVSDNVCACSEGYTEPTCNTPIYSLCPVNPCGQGERCGLLAGSHYCQDCVATAGGNSDTLLCQLPGERLWVRNCYLSPLKIYRGYGPEEAGTIDLSSLRSPHPPAHFYVNFTQDE